MEEKKNRHAKNIIFYHFKNFEIIYFLHSTSINQSKNYEIIKSNILIF